MDLHDYKDVAENYDLYSETTTDISPGNEVSFGTLRI